MCANQARQALQLAWPIPETPMPPHTHTRFKVLNDVCSTIKLNALTVPHLKPHGIYVTCINTASQIRDQQLSCLDAGYRNETPLMFNTHCSLLIYDKLGLRLIMRTSDTDWNYIGIRATLVLTSCFLLRCNPSYRVKQILIFSEFFFFDRPRRAGIRRLTGREEKQSSAN